MKIHLFILSLCMGCAFQNQSSKPSETHEVEKRSVAHLLDGFHRAAAEADGEAYFRFFHEDAVFLGTDRKERWSVSQFRAYAQPYFSKGKGWTYKPIKREVMFSPSGQVAWFDEHLYNQKYGHTRGSGVLIKKDGEWKIIHYVLSFPVPNTAAKEVILLIRKSEGETTP